MQLQKTHIIRMICFAGFCILFSYGISKCINLMSSFSPEMTQGISMKNTDYASKMHIIEMFFYGTISVLISAVTGLIAMICTNVFRLMVIRKETVISQTEIRISKVILFAVLCISFLIKWSPLWWITLLFHLTTGIIVFAGYINTLPTARHHKLNQKRRASYAKL